MAIARIPLRSISREELAEFNKHLCPPTYDGGPIDRLAPTRRISRNLTVDKNIELPGGDKINMWVIEDPEDKTSGIAFPSKIIRTVEGDIVHAKVSAKQNTHTIHWHGIDPTTLNDGVGKASFEISSDFTYQFATHQAGTYIYHCHKNTVLHFEMGLYGALIVDPKKPNTPEAQGVPQPPYLTGGPGFVAAYNPPHHVIKYDVEAIWVSDDIDTRWHKLGHDAFMQKCDPDDPTSPDNFTKDGILNNFRPDIFLISGEAKRVTDSSSFQKAAINCKVGQTVLLRFIDATYTVNEVKFGLPAQVIAQDGYPYGVPPRCQYSHPWDLPAGSILRTTPAMRFDLLFRPTQAGQFPCTIDYSHWITGKKIYQAKTFFNVK